MAAGRVGRYALVKLIGRGGMADVWIGKVQGAVGFEKIVAIKLLAPDQVDKEEYQRALTDEARIQVHLKHPNIVDVYDLNFEAENPYLVMEYVEGIELREVLRFLKAEKKLLPPPLVAFIVMEIAKALLFAHERKNPETGEPFHIVHRDVSPSNILLSIHGDVKLSDFGIAKSALQSAATQVGQIKGKFRYMSPEQAEGQSLDARSDIFSLGLVFFECLFGAPAYDDPSDIGILQKARKGQVVVPSGVAPELKNIFEKLLTRKSKDRYADLKTFIRDFLDFLKKSGEAMSDRDDLGDYLKTLKISRIQDVTSAKVLAERWMPEATAQILEQTGRIVTLEDIPRSKGWRWILAAGLALIVPAFFLLSSKKDSPPTVPAPASLETKPLVAEKPPAVEPPRPEVKKARVSFSADPYAEVTIPGVVSNVETPFSRILPMGDYTVSFRHGATGKMASAHLKATAGGAFLCSANMAVTDPTGSPTASCRVR